MNTVVSESGAVNCAPIGHNSGARDDDQRRRYDLNIVAISNWVGKRRVDEALSRQQLGELSGLDRLLTLRNATLDNLHQFYLTNPQADVAPGALAIVCQLSDNSEGCCTVSAVRIGQFLCRSERAVRAAINRLELDGCIKVDRRPGGTARIWPVINPVYAEHRDPMTWVLDAHAPTDRHLARAPKLMQTPRKAASGVDEPRKAASGVIKFPAVSMAGDAPRKAASGVASRRTPEGERTEPRKAASDDTAIDTAKEKRRTPPSPSARRPHGLQQIETQAVTIDIDVVTPDEAERITAVLEGTVVPPTVRATPARGTKPKAARPLEAHVAEIAPAIMAMAEHLAVEMGGPAKGWTAEHIKKRLTAFRLHWKANKRVLDKSGWVAAAELWLRDERFAPRTSGTYRPNRKTDAELMSEIFNQQD